MNNLTKIILAMQYCQFLRAGGKLIQKLLHLIDGVIANLLYIYKAKFTLYQYLEPLLYTHASILF
jgi:hypothetical protein